MRACTAATARTETDGSIVAAVVLLRPGGLPVVSKHTKARVVNAVGALASVACGGDTTAVGAPLTAAHSSCLTAAHTHTL